MKLSRCQWLSCLLLLASSNKLLADLDNSFGTAGIVTTSIGLSDQAQAVSLQSTDTYVVVAGSAVINGRETIVVARYTPSGELDSSFSTDGIQTTTIGMKSAANGLAIQADEKIVVGGFSYGSQTEFAVVRYNTNGSLDDTFNGSGIVTTPIGIGSDICDVQILSGDAILAGGASVSGGADFTLAQYTDSGSLDNAFGTSGIVIEPIGFLSRINALAIQANGRIIAAGYANGGSNNQFVLARFNTDGTLDDSFGSTGIISTEIGSDAFANDVIIQADGKIVVSGTTRENNVRKFAIVRYNVDGSLDDTFNSTGIVTTAIQNSAQASAIGLQSDGRIIVGGVSQGVGDTTQFTVARYTTAGVVDTTFGTSGFEITPIGTSAGINALAIQPDDKIVVAGYSDESFALARYEAQVT